mmetsp:Transcript_17319/g.30248  ORF Transcript_17319/g.30248 Transcript_17319/m.30248 type:complete len:231 (-) Transcript_17319:1567-2259(-)
MLVPEGLATGKELLLPLFSKLGAMLGAFGILDATGTDCIEAVAKDGDDVCNVDAVDGCVGCIEEAFSILSFPFCTGACPSTIVFLLSCGWGGGGGGAAAAATEIDDLLLGSLSKGSGDARPWLCSKPFANLGACVVSAFTPLFFTFSLISEKDALGWKSNSVASISESDSESSGCASCATRRYTSICLFRPGIVALAGAALYKGGTRCVIVGIDRGRLPLEKAALDILDL